MNISLKYLSLNLLSNFSLFNTFTNEYLGNITAKAKWEANTYKITYDVNGGEELSSNLQDVNSE